MAGSERLRAVFLAALGLLPWVACAEQSVPERLACRNGVPKAGDPTGSVEACDDGWRHRTQALTCPSQLPRERVLEPLSRNDQCQADADCTGAPHGHCNAAPGTMIGPYNYCVYGCVTNEDCSPGHLCECGTPVGQCVPAQCETDADCLGNALCATYDMLPGCPATGFACQTVRDRCIANSDCPANEFCTVVESDHRARQCVRATCQVGRPFLVHGEARLAPVAARGGWRGTHASPRTEALSREVRERLGAAWTDVARMEHASIAAFARFQGELLAFGAPIELVEACCRALADEIGHAKLAFGLASGYAGESLAPGPLDLSDAGAPQGFAASVEGALLEGCIGETVAALEALDALALATDPAVRAALSRITEDEARHAELSWRFVQWAITRSDTSLAERLRALVQRELSRCLAAWSDVDPADPDAHVLTAHGVASEAQKRRLRVLALRDVVEPCLNALLQGVADARRNSRVQHLRDPFAEPPRPCKTPPRIPSMKPA